MGKRQGYEGATDTRSSTMKEPCFSFPKRQSKDLFLAWKEQTNSIYIIEFISVIDS